MKASNSLWRERLIGKMPETLAKELDIFENEIALKKQGKIDDKVFAETRLRRGAYGQRYDNGERHDGKQARKLEYPAADLTKGPNTLWDAPGMQRIKIPFGGMNAEQLEVLADLAEEYSDGIAHVTTRQDIQLHFIHIDDVPALQRRLAAVGVTTREACGNTVRNVTACPYAGVCQGETFDVTPYAKAITYFLLGHPDAQNFGRKVKIAFSGCRDEACGLIRIHDIGLIAATREVDGQVQRGFEMYVGGGLGTVPYQSKVFESFVTEGELLPLCQAISRVFARLGEKKNRNTARLKFLVAKLGLEEFRRLVYEERAILTRDDRWTSYLSEVATYEESALKPPSLLQISPAGPSGFAEEFEEWRKTNVAPQRQQGYSTVVVALPLGDITSWQLRKLADVSRKYVKETIRATVEQNFLLRWVSDGDLPALYADLKNATLELKGAGTITDITACPGTDTCKLGISSSRGLAGELRMRLAGRNGDLDASVRGLRIKVSGCFNSCGQHHIADLGFYGVNRNKNGYAVPHFQVLLGGQWAENGGSYGLAIGAVPSKRIPEAVDVITGRYVAEKQGDESFQAYVRRIGKAECKKMLDPLTTVPAHDVDASFYTDWADAREYTLGDMGVGECAGEIVSPIEFALTACEREVFEAQLLLDSGDSNRAFRAGYESMLHSAAALLDWRMFPYDKSPDGVVDKFRKEFYDTELFFDRFVGGKFAQYLFTAHEQASAAHDADAARRLVEEAQLFLEACHSCYGRMVAQPVTA